MPSRWSGRRGSRSAWGSMRRWWTSTCARWGARRSRPRGSRCPRTARRVRSDLAASPRRTFRPGTRSSSRTPSRGPRSSGSPTSYIGVNALDYSGYPDCRPEYIEAFERLGNLASRAATEGDARLSIRAPLISKSKAEIIRWGASLGVDYARTWSCYDPDPGGNAGPVACGRCDSCILRRKGFREAGIQDPTRYAGDAPEE